MPVVATGAVNKFIRLAYLIQGQMLQVGCRLDARKPLACFGDIPVSRHETPVC